MTTDDKKHWKIVGGSEAGGIIVREGRETQSKPASRRLATGAIVLELERVDTRLRYTLVSGGGPEWGWISVSLKGKELAKPCDKPGEIKATSSCKDPTWSGDLETCEVTIGHLKAVVTRRPEGEPRAPFAVVMLPGNPVVNGYNASMPLPVAVDKAFGAAGFPVVRFDWDGTGMNKPGTREPSQDYEHSLKDTGAMYEYALKHLGEKVALCAWNFSGTTASKVLIHKWPEVCALVSLSFGYNQWEFVARFVHEAVGQALKADFEEHALLEVPALYVFGSKDVHTPEDVVRQKIVGARPDGGARAEVHVVDQSNQKLNSTEYFMMKDREDEVGQVCASWLNNLRMGLRVADSPQVGA